MSDGERRARVLLVEDDSAIRVGVTTALGREGYDVQAEEDGTSILAVAADFRPDMAILDVRLPKGPNGFEIARQLRTSGTDTDMPLLFLTAADDLQSRLDGFEAGGDDYLVKPFSMAELLARVQALLRRSGRLERGAWQVGDLVVDEDAHTVTRAGEEIALTNIEFQLLAVLIRNEGKVLSKFRLMGKVWGFDSFDANLVEKHVGALRRKLEAHGPRLLHTVRHAGYVLRVDPPRVSPTD